MAEPIAQKGVWIEGFTTVRQRKSGKQVRYKYFHLCTWDSKEKREQKRHLGSAKDSRYLQAREAIWRRDRLEVLEKQIKRLEEGELFQYCSVSRSSYFVRPLNPPILGDFHKSGLPQIWGWGA